MLFLSLLTFFFHLLFGYLSIICNSYVCICGEFSLTQIFEWILVNIRFSNSLRHFIQCGASVKFDNSRSPVSNYDYGKMSSTSERLHQIIYPAYPLILNAVRRKFKQSAWNCHPSPLNKYYPTRIICLHWSSLRSTTLLIHTFILLWSLMVVACLCSS